MITEESAGKEPLPSGLIAVPTPQLPDPCQFLKALPVPLRETLSRNWHSLLAPGCLGLLGPGAGDPRATQHRVVEPGLVERWCRWLAGEVPVPQWAWPSPTSAFNAKLSTVFLTLALLTWDERFLAGEGTECTGRFSSTLGLSPPRMPEQPPSQQ